MDLFDSSIVGISGTSTISRNSNAWVNTTADSTINTTSTTRFSLESLKEQINYYIKEEGYPDIDIVLDIFREQNPEYFL